ncbi:MAG TPA: hypothetical protein VGM84_23675 [Steroidobacteraceae bacterium]
MFVRDEQADMPEFPLSPLPRPRFQPTSLTNLAPGQIPAQTLGSLHAELARI